MWSQNFNPAALSSGFGLCTRATAQQAQIGTGCQSQRVTRFLELPPGQTLLAGCQRHLMAIWGTPNFAIFQKGILIPTQVRRMEMGVRQKERKQGPGGLSLPNLLCSKYPMRVSLKERFLLGLSHPPLLPAILFSSN